MPFVVRLESQTAQNAEHAAHKIYKCTPSCIAFLHYPQARSISVREIITCRVRLKSECQRAWKYQRSELFAAKDSLPHDDLRSKAIQSISTSTQHVVVDINEALCGSQGCNEADTGGEAGRKEVLCNNTRACHSSTRIISRSTTKRTEGSVRRDKNVSKTRTHFELSPGKHLQRTQRLVPG